MSAPGAAAGSHTTRRVVVLTGAIVLGLAVAVLEIAFPTGWRGVVQSPSMETLVNAGIGVPRARTGLVLTETNRGQVLFGRYCDSCHPGGGEGFGPNLRSVQVARSIRSTDDVVDLVRFGGFDMPPYPEHIINDADLETLGEYVLYVTREEQ